MADPTTTNLPKKVQSILDPTWTVLISSSGLFLINLCARRRRDCRVICGFRTSELANFYTGLETMTIKQHQHCQPSL